VVCTWKTAFENPCWNKTGLFLQEERHSLTFLIENKQQIRFMLKIKIFNGKPVDTSQKKTNWITRLQH